MRPCCVACLLPPPPPCTSRQWPLNPRPHPADRARAVLDDMLASGVAPSLATWSALVNAYAESNQPMRAIETLVGMRQRGLSPSVEVSSRRLGAATRGRRAAVCPAPAPRRALREVGLGLAALQPGLPFSRLIPPGLASSRLQAGAMHSALLCHPSPTPRCGAPSRRPLHAAATGGGRWRWSRSCRQKARRPTSRCGDAGSRAPRAARGSGCCVMRRHGSLCWHAERMAGV